MFVFLDQLSTFHHQRKHIDPGERRGCMVHYVAVEGARIYESPGYQQKSLEIRPEYQPNQIAPRGQWLTRSDADLLP